MKPHGIALTGCKAIGSPGHFIILAKWATALYLTELF